MSALKHTIEETVSAIFALDLDPIKFKLMDTEEGHGWSREMADRMEVEYKRFLILATKYPEESIVPSKSVDKFWHGHILDTAKYAEDCDTVFGYFLHHFPYFGMRGKEDAAVAKTASNITQRLYQQEFGNALDAQSAYCAIRGDQEAAYCALRNEQTAAYCAVRGDQEAAYCAIRNEQKAAYCAVRGEREAAYCAARGEREAAYCAVRKEVKAMQIT